MPRTRTAPARELRVIRSSFQRLARAFSRIAPLLGEHEAVVVAGSACGREKTPRRKEDPGGDTGGGEDGRVASPHRWRCQQYRLPDAAFRLHWVPAFVIAWHRPPPEGTGAGVVVFGAGSVAGVREALGRGGAQTEHGAYRAAACQPALATYATVHGPVKSCSFQQMHMSMSRSVD